jgi:hypothetical protein
MLSGFLLSKGLGTTSGENFIEFLAMVRQKYVTSEKLFLAKYKSYVIGRLLLTQLSYPTIQLGSL